LRTISYSLKDDDDSVEGWDKSTINYCMNNMDKIRTMVSKMCFQYNCKDRDDIQSCLFEDLYESEDFDPLREGGAAKSIDSYIQMKLQFVIFRYLKKMGNELALENIDHAVDNGIKERFEEVEIGNLSELLDNIEHKRDVYGIDVFSFLYLYFKLSIKFIDEEEIWNFMNVILKLDKRDVSKAYENMKRDEDFILAFRKIFSSGDVGIDISYVTEEIGNRVFGRKQFDNIIEEYFG